MTLLRIGAAPASAIARQSWYGRVYTYKVLQRMADQGVVTHTKKSGVINFMIPEVSLLWSYIQQQQQLRSQRYEGYLSVRDQMQELRQQHSASTPKIQLYEWKKQLMNLCGDMQQSIIEQSLLSIAVFGTHTFQEQIVSDQTVVDYMGQFADFMQQNKIAVTNYIAEGWLVMEQITKYPGIEKLWELPAGDNAINIFVIGKVVYVVIYKGQPVWLKIASQELAWALHFVLKQVG